MILRTTASPQIDSVPQTSNFRMRSQELELELPVGKKNSLFEEEFNFAELIELLSASYVLELMEELGLEV